MGCPRADHGLSMRCPWHGQPVAVHGQPVGSSWACAESDLWSHGKYVYVSLHKNWLLSAATGRYSQHLE